MASSTNNSEAGSLSLSSTTLPTSDRPSSVLRQTSIDSLTSMSSPVYSPHITSSPKLPPQPLSVLPKVECIVRARIPTTSGTEIWLHLYHNNADNKEHLAIVFGHSIRSKSLDAVKPGETEMDRMIRGAYVGRLYPGRTDSRNTGTSQLNPNSSRYKSEGDEIKQDTATETNLVPLVRIHSECYTGETAWSARCDCGEQLETAAKLMSDAGNGVIVYLRQEGMYNILNKIKKNKKKIKK